MLISSYLAETIFTFKVTVTFTFEQQYGHSTQNGVFFNKKKPTIII